jgi:hypothetical protein
LCISVVRDDCAGILYNFRRDAAIIYAGSEAKTSTRKYWLVHNIGFAKPDIIMLCSCQTLNRMAANCILQHTRLRTHAHHIKSRKRMSSTFEQLQSAALTADCTRRPPKLHAALHVANLMPNCSQYHRDAYSALVKPDLTRPSNNSASTFTRKDNQISCRTTRARGTGCVSPCSPPAP